MHFKHKDKFYVQCLLIYTKFQIKTNTKVISKTPFLYIKTIVLYFVSGFTVCSFNIDIALINTCLICHHSLPDETKSVAPIHLMSLIRPHVAKFMFIQWLLL